MKARLAPAALVMLPLVAVCVAWWPQFLTFPGIVGGGALAGGLLLIVAFQTRKAGQELQKKLFATWGSVPSTQLLRHRDGTIPALEKARYHALLQSIVPGVALPTLQEETASPDAADRNYEMAVGWLREQTRSNPVVVSENGNYGFYRNLCALRRLGSATAAIGIVGAVALGVIQWMNGNIDWAPIGALFISVLCALVFWLNAGPDQVRDAAIAYSLALIRAVDGPKKN